MLAGPDHFEDPFPLHLLLEPAKGLLEGFIFSNFNDWHVSMLLHRADRLKPPGRLNMYNDGPNEFPQPQGEMMRLNRTVLFALLLPALLMASGCKPAYVTAKTLILNTMPNRDFTVELVRDNDSLAAPDKAKALVAQSGYKGQEIICEPRQTEQPLTQACVGMWKAGGINASRWLEYASEGGP